MIRIFLFAAGVALATGGTAAAQAALEAVPAAAEVAAHATMPLAARDLPRGAVLRLEDLVPPVDSEAAELPVGWVTRRVVRAGEPLRPPTVAPPELVSTGKPVLLVWSGNGIELRMRGRAIGAGALGDRVSVRVDMKRRFEGVVAGPGLVRLENR